LYYYIDQFQFTLCVMPVALRDCTDDADCIKQCEMIEVDKLHRGNLHNILGGMVSRRILIRRLSALSK